MAEAAIGVCGFGRCGSTMVMGMLVAGGARCNVPPTHEEWPLPEYAELGQAVKLLDIFRHHPLPLAPAWSFVWLDRDPVQQGRSHIKFGNAMAGLDLPDEAALAYAASYAKDRPGCLSFLRAHGSVLVLQYERILTAPRKAAKALREVYPALDVTAAAAVVHPRDGACRPDLSVELAVRGAAV